MGDCPTYLNTGAAEGMVGRGLAAEQVAENDPTMKGRAMEKSGFMPDYSRKGRLKRWLASFLWRWATRKPPIVH